MIFEREIETTIDEIPITLEIHVEKSTYLNLDNQYDYHITDWDMLFIGNIGEITDERLQGFKALIGSEYQKKIDKILEVFLDEFEE